MRKPLPITALQEFGVNLAQAVEQLDWSLYDSIQYLQAGQSIITFFQEPIGGPSGKGFELTNMELNGQIPKGQQFLVEGICVEFVPAGDITQAQYSSFAADSEKIMNSGYLEFKIGSKLYKQHGPLGIFPQQYGLTGWADADAIVGPTANAYGVNRGPVHMIIPLTLTSNQNFRVDLKWDTAISISADALIRVRLVGRLFRNAQ